MNTSTLYRFIAISLLALCLPAQETEATTVRLLTLDELVQASARIFVGKCIDVRNEIDQRGLPVSVVTFEVTDPIKGAGTKFLTFRQIDGTHPGFANFGLPVYEEGEEALLFLHGPGRLGLTSPVGLYQGKWNVQYSAGQRFLQRSLPVPLTADGASGREYGMTLGKGLHDYRRFVGEVRRMVVR